MAFDFCVAHGAKYLMAFQHGGSGTLWEALHVWLRLERIRVPDGNAIAAAIDYSLNHWKALTANLEDGRVPIDNNHVENLRRPWAMGRKAWLFAAAIWPASAPPS